MKPIELLLAAISLVTLLATSPADASTTQAATGTDRRLAQCSWDRPGVDPFMGDVVAAVDHYRDISPETREKLKARMVKRDYDEIVSIDRDGIRGKKTYGTTIRDMHFGTNQVCGSVTRASWRADMKERGLVYCEGRECILVPTVCRNVSRISRAEVMGETATDDDGAPATALAAAPVAESPAGTGAGGGEPMAGGVGPGSGEARSFAMLSGGGGPVGGASGLPGGPGGVGSPSSRGSDRPGAVPGDDAGEPGVGPIGPGFPSSPITPRLPDVPSIDGPITPVPEPESLLLMAAGLAALGAVARRRASRRA